MLTNISHIHKNLERQDFSPKGILFRTKFEDISSVNFHDSNLNAPQNPSSFLNFLPNINVVIFISILVIKKLHELFQIVYHVIKIFYDISYIIMAN